jgi:peptidyl-prolyl cis-trans isomerase A (cyclophilin A)/peptidyl-prolyl cis-trans isomerase B (cyclophilin B)
MLRRIAALLVLALGLAAPAFAANPKVELDTSAGKITLELYPDAAPKTVANFLDYVKAGYYDGTVFHRVIDGFMIQGGGFTRDFKQKPTRPPVVNETEGASKAGLTNAVGTIAMARTADPNSATAQFFINVVDNTDKLGIRAGSAGYTPFGKVVGGMDVVNKIAKVAKGGGTPPPPGTPLDARDVPTEPIVINSAKIVAP